MSLRAEILSNTRPQRFLQKSGQRKGQHYSVKRGRSGRNVRVYETGDTALQPASQMGKQGQKTASIPKSKLVGVDHANAEVSEAQRALRGEKLQGSDRTAIGHGVSAHNDDITEARRAYARRRSGALQQAATAMSRVQEARQNKRERDRQERRRNAGGRS